MERRFGYSFVISSECGVQNSGNEVFPG